jgi:hypothetical protein
MHTCHRAAAPEGRAAPPGSAQPAEDAELFERLIRDMREGNFLVRCAWCRRYRVDGVWFEAPSGFSRWCDVNDRPTTHGICPKCLTEVSS